MRGGTRQRRTVLRERRRAVHERAIARLRQTSLQPMQTRGAAGLQPRSLRARAVRATREAHLVDRQIDEGEHEGAIELAGVGDGGLG